MNKGPLKIKVLAFGFLTTLSTLYLFFLIFRAYYFQFFKVADESMTPTLVKNEPFIVNKVIYRNSIPKRGDVIAFRFPKDESKVFVSRLIGFGGETVEIHGGQIIIDSVPYQRSNIYYLNKEPFGEVNQKIRIPINALYVLGDNSTISSDSRVWDFVPKANMIGKVYIPIRMRSQLTSK